MNRRDLFKGLFSIAAVPVLTPLEKLLPAPAPVKAVIGQYADYTSYSDIAFQTAIDPSISYINNKFVLDLMKMNICKPLPLQEGKLITFYNYKL